MKDIKQIVKGTKVKMPTKWGNFSLIPFLEINTGLEHMALFKGDFNHNQNVLARIHSACATGDLFGSLRCDCREQLNQSLQLIEKSGNGIVVYLQQEGRGIGLMNKMKAYKLQEEGYDTVDANVQLGFAPDERNYEVGATILKLMNIKKVKLITNNPAKIEGLQQYGIEVTERVDITIPSNTINNKYLNTKIERMGHLMSHKIHTQQL